MSIVHPGSSKEEVDSAPHWCKGLAMAIIVSILPVNQDVKSAVETAKTGILSRFRSV